MSHSVPSALGPPLLVHLVLLVSGHNPSALQDIIFTMSVGYCVVARMCFAHVREQRKRGLAVRSQGACS